MNLSKIHYNDIILSESRFSLDIIILHIINIICIPTRIENFVDLLFYKQVIWFHIYTSDTSLITFIPYYNLKIFNPFLATLLFILLPYPYTVYTFSVTRLYNVSNVIPF